MRIVEIAAEAHPFAKVGGLADVVGALPPAFAGRGHDVDVFLPGHRCILRGSWPIGPPALTLTVPVAHWTRTVQVRPIRLPGTPVRWHVLACDPLFDRDGLYGGPAGPYPDDGERFAVFARAALAAAEATGGPPDIVHAHDWHAALAPVYLRTLFAGRPAFAGTRSVLTIHSAAYQGRFGPDVMRVVGLDISHFNPAELESYGGVSYLKGGAAAADLLTTVSPRHALEIQTPEGGFALDGLFRLRARDLHGILNGIDTRLWDPAKDPFLPAPYDARHPAGKAACKRALQRETGLPGRPEVPLLAFIGRLVYQKGVDLLAAALPDLLRRDIHCVVLGAGDPTGHAFFEDLRRRHPDRFAARLGFDEAFAHRLEAGADLLLMPSRYEPCGLNQMYSHRYGTVPVVRETGGLADTVVDATDEAVRSGRATGFVFRECHPGAFRQAVDRALETFGDQARWNALVRTGMRQDWSWARSADRYLALFESLRPPVRRAAGAPARPRRRGPRDASRPGKRKP